MIKAFHRTNGTWQGIAWEPSSLPGHNLWIDLISPNAEEIGQVQQHLSLEIPSRAEMEEIEASSRLYQDNGAYFMTATVITNPDIDSMVASAVTFILTKSHLITVRYVNPKPFEAFAARIQKPGNNCASSTDLIIGVLEMIIDRMADILELHSAEVERISKEIFGRDDRKTAGQISLKETITALGMEGNHFSIVRESLVSVSRLAIYLNQAVTHHPQVNQLRDTLKEISRDLSSLADHASFMSSKINFLLDATLGMINIEQNQIIKLFSVAAVVFLPPTLIASIYGMNFEVMPELRWIAGYPLAIVLMIISALLPYLYFKRKGWL